MKILLRPNMERPGSLSAARQVAQALSRKGFSILAEEAFAAEINSDIACQFGLLDQLVQECDILMPVGGDGTIMRAVKHAVKADKPILGVNAGRVGFLTGLEIDELDRLDRLQSGGYRMIQRMMLEVELPVDGTRRVFSGLNDIVVAQRDSVRIADIDVSREGKLIARHRADGLIFATPTGSTAYSLSAGGPIADPEMSLILMTAICSHSTFDCALVLPTGRDYAVDQKTAESRLHVVVDGELVGKLGHGETLIVRESSEKIRFVDLGIRDFYQNVNNKLSWGRKDA